MSRLDAASLLPPPPPPTKPRRPGCLLPSAAVALFFLVFLRSPPNPPPNYVSLFLSLGSNDTAALHLRLTPPRPHPPPPRRGHQGQFRHRRLRPPRALLPLLPGAHNALLRPPLLPRPPLPLPLRGARLRHQVLPHPGHLPQRPLRARLGGGDPDLLRLLRLRVGVCGGRLCQLRPRGRLRLPRLPRRRRCGQGGARAVWEDPLRIHRAQRAQGGRRGRAGVHRPSGVRRRLRGRVFRSFPNTQWLPPTGVQIGSLFSGVGDPTTPMWASSEGCEHVSVEDTMASDDMPGIPALPVSARDATKIHRVLGGAVAPAEWQGREDGPVYHLGPGPAVLNLTYAGNDTMATIENVFAVIEGAEEPDSHQDFP